MNIVIRKGLNTVRVVCIFMCLLLLVSGAEAFNNDQLSFFRFLFQSCLLLVFADRLNSMKIRY